MFRPFDFLAPKDFKIIWFSNIFPLALSVPEEGCYRNVLCAVPEEGCYRNVLCAVPEEGCYRNVLCTLN